MRVGVDDRTEHRWQVQDDVIEVACHAVRLEMERQGIDAHELARRMGAGRSGAYVNHMLKGNLTIRDLADCADALKAKVLVRLEAE